MTQVDLLEIAKGSVDTLLAKFTPEELPPAGRFHYHQSVFLMGVYELYKVTKEERYLDYIIRYFNNLIDEYGNVVHRREELDTLQVAVLLFDLFEITGDQRYRKAIERVDAAVPAYNLTSENGFWHKDRYPYQMWLDGLFMAGPFMLRVSKMFARPMYPQFVLYQQRLMKKNMLDPETGLLYHAWDEKRQQPWADRETGCSPEFWGRSVGWYGTAIIDILRELKGSFHDQDYLIPEIRRYIDAIIPFQHPETHVWYQIIDKSDNEDNWPESSSTALYLYVISEALREGYLTENLEHYKDVLNKGLSGLLKEFIVKDETGIHLNGICIGTSAGVYDYYVDRPRSEDDLHGVGAFLLAIMSIYHAQQEGVI